MADFFWFSDEQWARIEPLLPRNTRGRKRVDDRRVLSGIATRFDRKITNFLATIPIAAIVIWWLK